MKAIVLATRNLHKLKEFKRILPEYNILTLDDIGYIGDIEETGTTFEENSFCKTRAVFEFCKQKGLDFAVIADDSGLVVNALGGAPGVYSARYSGDHDDEGNNNKLLRELEGKEDRSAYYECVITYKDSLKEHAVSGKMFGSITKERLGSNGFGYDPLFYADKLGKTFGEATSAEKDAISHRAVAINKLKDILPNLLKD